VEDSPTVARPVDNGEEKGRTMTKLSKLLIATALFSIVAAMTVASASAGLPRPDQAKVLARGMVVRGLVVRRASPGLPPVFGGPFGDPTDYPGAVGSSVRGDTTRDTADPSSGDDCLHQIVQPRTAC
jgi:hypothetical protein